MQRLRRALIGHTYVRFFRFRTFSVSTSTLEALESEIQTLRRELDGEKRARVAAEAELRSAAEQRIAQEGWTLAPIGSVSSPLQRRFGTPRQGLLAPALKGRIVLDSVAVSREAMRGLEEFSHAWFVL